MLLIKTNFSLKVAYLDNYGDGIVAVGRNHEDMNRYALLANDLVSDLPNRFTICGSTYIEYRTSASAFFQLYQENGAPWFNFYCSETFSTADFKENFAMAFDEEFFYIIDPHNVSVVPHSWMRGCLGLDTVSGQLRV